MELPKDRRILIGGGAVLALVVILLLASLMSPGKQGGEGDDTASPGLKVEVGREDGKVDPNRQLPCYVNGQSIGMTTHAVCAERNGVAGGQLDVGIDKSGELAYGSAGALLIPLPPEEASAEAPPKPAPATAVLPAVIPLPQTAPQAVRGSVAACWRYADRDWLRMPDMSLQSCVQSLFDGRCEKVGGATYGRWGEQTLRLVPGQIEQSPDNRSFRTLVRQGANCSVPVF